MYIHSIHLKNLRGFGSLTFELTRPDGRYAGWTAFTGDNGSGKSTLLRAVAVALVGRDHAYGLNPNFNGWIRECSDGEAGIELKIHWDDRDDAFSSEGRRPKQYFQVKLELKNGGKTTTIENASKEKTPDRTIWSSAAGWFSCGYGPFRRVFGASSDAARIMNAPVKERFVTMFQEAASLSEVDLWMRELRMKEMEGRATEKSMLALLMELLRDDLLPVGITVDHVDSDGLWLKDQNGVSLSWADMSDGYRAVLALTADIVRHLMNTYGTGDLTERNAEGRLCFRRGGVVLIDEIDAHLHPEWQQRIGFWLKERFPNIQFLVTTHSPLILQAADPNGLFVLPAPGRDLEPRRLDEEEYRRVVAARPDTILLSQAFSLKNTRSLRAVQSRSELATLNAKRRAGAELSDEEGNRLRQLELNFPEEED